MPPVGQHADDEEQAAGADAVIQHLVHRALHALPVQRGDPEHDEAEMAHARIRDELLHVGLHHRNQSAVDDAHNRQRRQRGRECDGRVRKQREGEPHESVGAHLEEHTRKNHRA